MIQRRPSRHEELAIDALRKYLFKMCLRDAYTSIVAVQTENQKIMVSE